MKRNGKNWFNNITLEWHSNPPRRNTKANNRFRQEIRRRLVKIAGEPGLEKYDLLSDDAFSLDAMDVIRYDVRSPRGLAATICESANESMGEMVSIVGMGTYDRVRSTRFSSYKCKQGTGKCQL